MSTANICPWCGMETIDTRVCTWCRRALERPLRAAPQMPVQALPRKSQSPLVAVIVSLFVALVAVLFAFFVVLEKKDPAVAETSNGAEGSAPSGQPSTGGLGSVESTPIASAPAVTQGGFSTGARSQAPPAASAGNRFNGGSGKTSHPVSMAEPNDASVQLDNPPLAFRVVSFHRVSPGAQYKTEFHCSLMVRNNGRTDIDYRALPAVELVFDDGTSYRAEPAVLKSKGGADAKQGGWSIAQSGEASIPAGASTEVEFIAYSNTAPASPRLIAVQIQVRGGAGLDLPLPG